MVFIWLMLGAFFGWLLSLAGDTDGIGVISTLLGAAIGLVFGLYRNALGKLRAQHTELESLRDALSQFRSHFGFVTGDVHNRLLKLEAAPDFAQPTPPLRTAPPVVPPETPIAENVATPPDAPLEFEFELESEPAAPVVAPAAVPPAPVPAPAPAPEIVLADLGLLAVEPPLNIKRPAPIAAEVMDLELIAPIPAAAPAALASTAAPVAPIAPPATSPLPKPAPAPRRTPPRRPPAEPGVVEQAFAAAKAWLFGGNTVVKVGLLLVFFGVAFLLRYAAERVVIPIELRYVGITLGTMALLGFGWRVRESKRGFGLMLQGGAIALLYLTTFAAMRLHHLLPVGMAFGLLAIIAVAAAVLAVAQNAMGLAVIGTLGGFAAPILTSTGSGNHVGLFTYFILLNVGIAIVAWFKAWRPLNLIGFVGTFMIGLAWGLKGYVPAKFASTEPFLIFFFVLYVLIGVLFTRRRLADSQGMDDGEGAAWQVFASRQADWVDATLLFGVPLVGFGLQFTLVREMVFGAAWSALALGGFYAVLSSLLLRAQDVRYRALVEIYLALAVVFGSLAIPLACSAEWTAAAWAMEGAGIYWIGLRQNRPLARAFAVLLQTGALIALFSKLGVGSSTVFSGPALGTGMMALGWLGSFAAWRHAKQGDDESAWDQHLGPWLSLVAWVNVFILPALLFSDKGTVIAWAGLALVATYLGLRSLMRSWVAIGLLGQLLAGGLFLMHLQHGGGEGVLHAGQFGLLIACALGLSMLLSMVLANRAASQRDDPGLRLAGAVVSLGGLMFIALAALLVLPWLWAAGVWALEGFAMLWLAQRFGMRPMFWFGVGLQIAAGLAFAHALFDHIPADAADVLRFRNGEFWSPLIMGLAAYCMAWRIWLARRQAGDTPLIRMALDVPLLVWATLWWGFAWFREIHLALPVSVNANHAQLFATAISGGVAWYLARRLAWRGLGGVVNVIWPMLAISLLRDYTLGSHPLDAWGGMAYAFSALLVLWVGTRAESLFSTHWVAKQHLASIFIGLGLIALELRFALSALADKPLSGGLNLADQQAWGWLGWSTPLIAYVFWMARAGFPKTWPRALYPSVYRDQATLPLLLLLLVWLVWANVASDGSAAPLPYFPVVNPLELSFIAALISMGLWVRQAPETAETWVDGFLPILRYALAATAFLTYSAGLMRAVHHVAGVSYVFDVLMVSKLVQASLSIGWTVLALALMIGGNRLRSRQAWISGAVLMTLVVIKLFLVDRANSGGVERIVVFLVVGGLMLVVGYFAPLPTKNQDETEADADPDTQPLPRDPT